MNVDIYIIEISGNRSIQIPWLPETINFTSGGTVRATYDILDKGPVEVPTGSGLRGYSWKSEFPGENRPIYDLLHGSYHAPSYYKDIIEDWRRNKTRLHLLVTGYPINIEVILDDFTYKATGGFGDIEYEIKLLENRNITIQSTIAETKEPERSTAPTTSYTVKSGDNLWNIAASKLGAGSKWRTIYDANKEIIESTAKKYGKSSSNNGHWIYPGTVLTIPS